MSDLYREIIIDHYKHPKNVGEITDADVVGHDDNVVCGDAIDVFLSFDDEGMVREVKWKGEGCALSQASASLLTEMIKGKTRQQIAQITEHDILNLLGTKLNPSRQACATLSVHALFKGLQAHI